MAHHHVCHCGTCPTAEEWKRILEEDTPRARQSRVMCTALMHYLGMPPQADKFLNRRCYTCARTEVKFRKAVGDCGRCTELHVEAMALLDCARAEKAKAPVPPPRFYPWETRKPEHVFLAAFKRDGKGKWVVDKDAPPVVNAKRKRGGMVERRVRSKLHRNATYTETVEYAAGASVDTFRTGAAGLGKGAKDTMLVIQG